MACKYGSHRVLEPKGVLPQPALRLDNDFSAIAENEIPVLPLVASATGAPRSSSPRS